MAPGNTMSNSWIFYRFLIIDRPLGKISGWFIEYFCRRNSIASPKS